MAVQVRCGNANCRNVDRGVHMTQQAADVCRRKVPGPIPASAATPPTAPRQPPALASLAEASALGHLTGDDIVCRGEFARLDADEREVLLDLIAADSEYAPREAFGDDLVAYIREANTGLDSLTDWAEQSMHDNPTTVASDESPETYAQMALLNEIWVLPNRDDPERYRVMLRAEAL